jgi:hypothetical protein
VTAAHGCKLQPAQACGRTQRQDGPVGGGSHACGPAAVGCGWLLLAWLAAGPALAEPSSADAHGFTFAAQLVHAAYHVAGVPSVIVHAPPHFDAHTPLHLVVFLHGYSGCIPVLMGQGELPCRSGELPQPGWDLGAQHDAADTNTLFVVPQLAFMQRNGRPGAFAQPGGFRAFLEELLSGPLAARLSGPHTLADVASVDLIAHSAGYTTALAILEHGGLGKLIQSVVLLDALYGETPRFARYIETHAAAGLRFVSIALPNGRPELENRALLQRLQRSLGHARVASAAAAEIAAAIAEHAIVIAEGVPPHRLVPAHHMAEVLRALHANRDGPPP